MQNTNVKARIRQFINANFPLTRQQAALTDDASLLNSGLVDSLGVLDLVTFIENEFGVMVADEDLAAENFETIGQIAVFVHMKQTQKVLA